MLKEFTEKLFNYFIFFESVNRNRWQILQTAPNFLSFAFPWKFCLVSRTLPKAAKPLVCKCNASTCYSSCYSIERIWKRVPLMNHAKWWRETRRVCRNSRVFYRCGSWQSWCWCLFCALHRFSSVNYYGNIKWVYVLSTCMQIFVANRKNVYAQNASKNEQNTPKPFLYVKGARMIRVEIEKNSRIFAYFL